MCGDGCSFPQHTFQIALSVTKRLLIWVVGMGSGWGGAQRDAANKPSGCLFYLRLLALKVAGR